MPSKKLKSAKEATTAADSATSDARARATGTSGGRPSTLSSFTTQQPSAGSVRPAPAARGLVLGVDGGGSHTVALVASAAARDGERTIEVLGRGASGPSNHRAVGRDRAIRSLDEAINAAFREAGVPRDTVAAACLGLAGADRAADREMFVAWAKSIGLADRVRVENDASLVLDAGTPEGWGLAVIAGTGSFALAQTQDGRTRRSGGWGYLLGDEGSGYAIALEALRAVARAADGRGPATSLTPAILARLHIADSQALVSAVYRDDVGRAEVAALANVVSRETAAGDSVAQHILVQASVELSNLAIAAARIFSDEVHGAIPVALSGGVFAADEQIRDELVLNLLTQGLKPEPVQFVSDPAMGAIRMARRAVE